MIPRVFCLLLALFPVAASAQTRTIARQELPIRFDGTRPAVEIRVNGQGPFLFLIDTGAAGAPARADVSLVKRLALRISGATMSSDAGGASATIDRVTLDRVDVGSWTSRAVEALSRDYNGTSYLPHIDGILGFAFFENALLTIDFPRGRVVIEPGALPPADGKTILDYELIDGNPAIGVSIGGRREKALIDTGDIRALDVPAAWLKTMRLASFPRIAGSSTSVSGVVPIREVALTAPLMIGAHRIERPNVTFADEFDVANIGSALLQDFVMTFDQRNRRVRIVQAR